MYIGIDLGTTACKTVLFNDDGTIVSEFNKEYNLIFKGKFVEQDANDWWNLVLEGLRFVVSDSGCKKISGISVSTQSISFVPVDINGNTLYNAISWLDTRAFDLNKNIADKFGKDKIYEITGKECLPDYSLSKLWWLKKYEPEVYNNAFKIIFPLDFLNLRLTGNIITDYTTASGSMAYDIYNKCWSNEILSYIDFDINKLPEVGCLGDFVGFLKEEICHDTGIEYGCKIFLGGQDQKLAAIGAGISDNVCTVSFGTATAISKFNSEKLNVPVFRFNNDKLISEIAIMTTGAALKWLKNTLYEGVSYKDMDVLASKSCSGANGVQFKPDLTIGGTISGLTLSTTKSDIVYALYEGVAYDIDSAIKKLGGAEYLQVFGGGSKSQIWCEILARITGIEVHILNTSETASLGAAILASNYNIPVAKTEKIIKP